MDSTKGPWTVGELIANDGGVAVLFDDGRVCLVDAVSPVKRGQGWTHQDADRDARARLVAAAPDLLEALKAAKAFHDRDSGCNGFTADYECLRLQIDEALAKALPPMGTESGGRS